MNWKNILALAVLTTPVAYCTVDDQRNTTNLKITCIQEHGEWHKTRGGYCEFKERSDAQKTM